MNNNLNELKESLVDLGFEDSVLFENPDYATAVVGVSEEGRVIYDFNRMVDFLMQTENMENDEAIEFIEYNTIRALPYAGDLAPIILYPLEDN